MENTERNILGKLDEFIRTMSPEEFQELNCKLECLKPLPREQYLEKLEELIYTGNEKHNCY